MVTCGLINVVSHTFGLLIILIIGVMAKRCLRLSTMLQLRVTGRALIAYDTITSASGAFLALKLLMKNFSLTRAVMVLLVLFCIPAELVFDFGVSSSEKCRPIRFRTFGLCAAPLEPRMNIVPSATIFHHTTEWDDK